ncbi:uncharacterized protein SCHCODRAFT_02247103 [Schizophyllum commune H4-8]|nr:uncharacterized protein SCHCODRAFT_02247103 [Schizophyllum commune H4-8]KAI5893190.1 hypothetical protein SCHCODRAFT_02247103 [Schizophyllum commune H4-8]
MAATFSHCMVTQYAYGPEPAESDIVDARDEPVDLCDNLRDIPERPPARLDFNGVDDDDYEPEEVLFLKQERAHAATLRWTRSLLERSNTTQDTDDMDADEDMDITGANPDDSYDSCPSLDSSSSSISVASSMSSTSLSSTTFGMGDLDNDDAPADEDTSGSSSHSSMDIDADPFGSSYTDSIQAPSPLCPLIAVPHDTAEHEHKDEVSLLRRHCYSLLPSPLSPNRKPATHSQSTTARHCYRHHGFSRQAFMHLKWFWAVRQEEWEEYTNNVRDAKAYGGVESDSEDCIRAPWSRSPRPSIIEEPSAPPLTIHPRRGDLSALRDPYAAHIDRCFVSLPLWTMNKTLWMFDVHTAREYAAYKARAPASLAGPSHDYADDSDDEPMLVSVPTTATSLSDDSDVTLVDSETGDSSDDSDCETHAGHWQRRGACIIGAATVASMNIKASAFKHSTEDDDDFMMLEDVNLNESGPASAGRCPSSVALAGGRAGAHCPPWQTNWYRRWELLIELMRHDRERATVATPSPPQTPRPSGRKPHFYFAGDDESDGWSELV